MNVKLVFRADT